MTVPKDQHPDLVSRVARLQDELDQLHAVLGEDSGLPGSVSEAHLRSVLEASPMGLHLYALHDDNRLIFSGANAAADRILGVDHAQFVGLDIEEAFPSLRGTEVPERYRAAARDGTRWSTENIVYEDQHITGAYEVYAFQIVPGRMATQFLDITERKRAEAEHRVLEAKLQQAQKLESLGMLAGGIAHDFNNLLCGILGGADLALLDIPDRHPAREALEPLRESAQRATELCRQLLAYAGKGRFVVEPVDLSDLVQRMGQILRVSIARKVALRYELKEELPAVEADATQLRQVVLNLIINASEAVGDRNGAITLATGVMDCDESYLRSIALNEALPAGRYVFLEVSDSGVGMDAATRQRLFDPFFTTKFTGRGLGLAAVLGIVRGHRGTIKVYSEPGQGSSFKILLPASDQQVRHQIAQVHDEVWRGTGLCLLVDDEPMVREVGERMLRRLGYEVQQAEDGERALQLFDALRDRITLIVLDMTMPRLNGEETFRELRARSCPAPVILVSGYNEQDATRHFTGKGLAGFLQKPFQLATLREVVRAAVEGTSAPRGSGTRP
ncbi:MAG: response regulator [Pseudomonadota bacterium]